MFELAAEDADGGISASRLAAKTAASPGVGGAAPLRGSVDSRSEQSGTGNTAAGTPAARDRTYSSSNPVLV